MTKNSAIQWTHHTFNAWIGCTKISPGCDNCYAEKMALRFGWAEWGANKLRRLASDDYWRQPLAWDASAAKRGVRERVFCASLADVFDNEVDDAWRARLWVLIAATPNLDWLLLTKRIGNVEKMLPGAWSIVTPRNVWLGITVVNQEEADRDIPKLYSIQDFPVKFLSMEPLLEPVILPASAPLGINWIIVGGESGHGARPLKLSTARFMRDQCIRMGIPFFFKQWGEWSPRSGIHEDMRRVGKKIAGREIEGREWNEFPGAYHE